MKNRQWKLLQQSDGNTLIMVLMGLGLTTLIALSLADVFAGAFKTNRSITQAVEAEQITNLIQLSMSKKEACEQALLLDAAGNPLPSRTVTEIKGSFSLTDLRIPQASGGSVSLVKSLTDADCQLPQNAGACNGTVVSSIEVRPKKDAAGNDISSISNDYLIGEIAVTYRKTGAVTGASTLTRVIPIGFNIDPATQKIISCQAGGGSTTVQVPGTNQPTNSNPKRRCAAAIYADRPWAKERIYCKTRWGGVAVLSWAGDNLKGLSNSIAYSSPHGDKPMTIIYDSSSGAFRDAQWADDGDAESCVGKNLKQVAVDAENQCVD
nr:hypothetical protein BdHM001_11440 [Bdellovibrio sp. HM001]